MNIDSTINFDLAANFSFDVTKIEIVGAVGAEVAQLKLEPATQQFVEDFADDTGHTFDNLKAEFVGGVVRQVDKADDLDATFAAKYTDDIDATWGNGVLTGTAVGGADVASGKLNLKGATLQYVDYNADKNADSEQEGCVRFEFTPNYSGTPAGFQTPITIIKANGIRPNRILIHQRADNGNLEFEIRDSADGILMAVVAIAGFNPTAGVPVEMELNWNLNDLGGGNGATRFFVDGVQKGATNTAIGTRDSSITILRVGSDWTAGQSPDFEIDNLQVYSTVQHTGNYTPVTAIPDIRAEGSSVDIPQFVHSGVGFITDIADLTTVETGTPKYVSDAGGQGFKWFNSAASPDPAWEDSDGTYAQSNSAAEVTANIATYPKAPVPTTIDIRINFTDSPIVSNVDNLQLDHTGHIGFFKDNPSIIQATGLLVDGISAFSAVITASGSDAVQHVLEVDGQDKWWDGGAWANSSGFAESNTAADINTNIGTLDLSAGASTKWKTYLHSDDGSGNVSISSLSFSYNFFVVAADTIPTCTVFGDVKNLQGSAAAGVLIEAIVPVANFHIDNLVAPTKVTATTGADGKWDLTLAETASTKRKVKIKITYPTIADAVLNSTHSITIPNQISEKFSTLAAAA